MEVQKITVTVVANTAEYEEQLFKVSQALRNLQIEVDKLKLIEMKTTIK